MPAPLDPTVLPVIEDPVVPDSVSGGPAGLLGRTSGDLSELAVSLGQPPYRGKQIARGIYERGARSVQDLTDLPAAFRSALEAAVPVGRSTVAAAQASRDGTVKLLLELADGKRIETVVLPYPDRVSVCISSQVGCPVGCTFCATATMGFGRNLTAGEMVDQVITAREQSPTGRISHVVVMGMGEPLLNYDNLLRALRLLHDELGMSYRHLTISTAGYVPGIDRLAEEGLPVTLALSLHAPNDALRSTLIPMSKKWGVDDVMAAVRRYTEKTGRRVTLEYLLLAGINDDPSQAEELAGLLEGMIGHVNLIPWNPAASLSAFQAPDSRRVAAFRAVLAARGVSVTQRVERGQDIQAACGQLAVSRKAA